MIDWKQQIRARLASLSLEATRESEIVEELAQHLEERLEELLSHGVASEEAARAVLAELSDEALLAKELRRVERSLSCEPDVLHFGRMKMFGDVWRDLRYGARLLARRPGFASIAVITLALGIGANTAIFSVVYAVLMRPLPYPEPDRLVWLTEQHEQIPTRWISYPNFLDWRDRNQSFESIALIRGRQMTLTGSGEAQSVNARMVTADYFRVMRAAPMLGRGFDSAVDKYGAPRVAVLSHAFWQSQFGGDPDIVGRPMTLDNQSFNVIGVMPAGFQHQGPPALWVSTEQYAEPGSGWFRREDRVGGFVIGRLKAEVTIEQARGDMKSIEQQLIADYPMQNGGNVIRLATLQDSIVGESRQSLLLLFAAVGLVLLIACANVANLLLARAATRRKEFAIRAAMGASRWRLLRQLLIESVMLATAGGALSLLLARWCIDLLVRFAPEDLPRMGGVTIGWRVLGFTLALSVLTGIIFGVAPAWQSARTDLHETLRDGGRTTADTRSARLRSAFVVSEVALAMVLLVSAGLLIKSLARLLASDPGFSSKNVVTMRLLPRQAYEGREQLTEFYSRVLERVGSLPGVEAASVLNDDLPGLEPGWQNDINPEVNGEYLRIKPGELINVDWGIVTEDYFKTMRIPILQGRSFSPQEGLHGGKVLLIDQQLARQFWPQGDAIGKHIKYDGPEPHEIIGVVGDVRNYGSETPGRIKMYTPFRRWPLPTATLAVRTAVDGVGLIPAIKAEVLAINRNVPIYEIATLEDQLGRRIAPRRFNTWLLGLFALVALVLAAIGIYGVMSYSVTERTHEIGVRRALGAQDSDVLKLVIRRGLTLTLIGAAIGLASSLALSRVLSSLMFGVSALDPATLLVVAALLVVVALAACYAPARRATRVDPMAALRYE